MDVEISAPIQAKYNPRKYSKSKKIAVSILFILIAVMINRWLFNSQQTWFLPVILGGVLTFFTNHLRNEMPEISVKFEDNEFALKQLNATLWWLPYNKIESFEFQAAQYQWKMLTTPAQILILTDTDSYVIPASSQEFADKVIQQLKLVVAA
ncbi:hypothetical protein [Catenovulum agarivorans]|uniref:hypothetical protein n=1 Tax=Catenovulum agarivorans TaxID=1172192 RepID=UPI000376A019|nr:hypothetical protein [Catenovulum agarivorans]